MLGLESFVYMDSSQFAYPSAFYHRQAFWRGEWPLWNPLNNCGIPFLAQWNTLTLYPLSLFYLLLPLPWSFEIFCLGHLFLAGLGMYFLAGRWTGHRLAAAVAGIAFAFNGLTWHGLMWPSLIAALAWMPWLLLAVDKAWIKGGRWIVPAALATAMQILTGGAEVVLITWLFMGGWWLTRLARGGVPRSNLVLRMTAIGLLAAGLTAVQTLPFLVLLTQSERSATYARAASGFAALPLSGWANYFVPLFRCTKNPEGLFVQPNQVWIASYYLGVGVLLLALLALWRVRNVRVWLLAAAAVGGVVLAFGSAGHVYDVAKRVLPVLGLIRFPVKFLLIDNFMVPVLAAFGLARFLNPPPDSRFDEWKSVSMLAGSLIVLIASVAWFNWRFPMQGADVAATIRCALVRVGFLLLILGALLLLRIGREQKTQGIAGMALLVLLWLDVATHAPDLSPAAASGVLKPDAVRQSCGWTNEMRFGVSRAMLTWDAIWKMGSAGSTDPQVDTTARRLSLFMDLNILDQIAKADGSYSTSLRYPFELFSHVYLETNQVNPLKDFLGVSHISNPTNPVDWIPRDSFLPMITAGQRPVFAADEDSLRAVLSEEFKPEETVYLPIEARGQVQASRRSKATIRSVLYSANRIQMQVKADEPAIVVLAQAHYPNWRAYVDGREVTLWRANYAFQALEVPAGDHEIVLRYEDRMFQWGAVISGLSSLACLAVWIRFRRADQPPERR